MLKKVLAVILFFSFASVYASSSTENSLDLTNHWAGYISLLIFIIAYGFVMVEEVLHLRKSKPIVLSAGVIWALVAAIYVVNGFPHAAEVALRHNLLEFAELFLFLLVAMTYIEAITERQVFDALKVWLIKQGFGFRKLFWITGIIAFFLSPIADNLTTALIMGAVVLSVGSGNKRFISLAFINIVVAANAGGAFSPFGDITTLMVWQKGIVQFEEFLPLFIPSAINYIIPATIMSFAIKDEKASSDVSNVEIKKGGIMICFLFLATIITAISFHNFLHLPPFMGMMTGLGYLMLMSYYIKKKIHDDFDVFNKISRAEWDTLLFFFGVILSVGGLGFIGYLAFASEFMYIELGPTTANVLVGILSAIIDNIPVMFAVLTMEPQMSLGQWLLVTLTAGVGGSLLSIGSAAGVALMGQSKGYYTFFSHIKWMPVIAIGYAASIVAHLIINASLF